MSHAELAEGLVEVDTAGWAEGWEKLSGRIKEGFETIAKEMEEQGGGNAFGCQPRMTIGTMVYLINGMHPHGLDNGSATILEYENASLQSMSLVTVAIGNWDEKMLETNS